MTSRLAAAALVTALLAGCQVAPAMLEPFPAPAPPPPPPTADALPASSMLTVRLDQRIDMTTHNVGDRFAVTVIEPVIAQTGEVVVPAGAVIGGQITGLGAEGPDVAAVRVYFDVLRIGQQSFPFEANVVHTRVPADPQRAQRAIEGALVGAAAGAMLGAIVREGELQGILIGGALGAGAGTIIALGLADDRAGLPAGTVMTLQTTQRVALR